MKSILLLVGFLSTLFSNDLLKIAPNIPSDTLLFKALKFDSSLEFAPPASSIENLQRLKNGNVDFAVIQAETLYHDKNTSNICVIAALYTKKLLLITRKESNITSITNPNIAIVGDDTLPFLRDIFRAFKITTKYPQQTLQEAKEALKKNKIDAFLLLQQEPNSTIKLLLKESNLTIIPLYGKKYDQLARTYAYFQKSAIPKNSY